MKNKIIKEGYIYIKVPYHPFSHRGYVAEHRLVVEDFIGRYLHPSETVHHINGNKMDNRISNLFLFKSHKEHRRFENRVKSFGVTNPIAKQIKERWSNIPVPIIRE